MKDQSLYWQEIDKKGRLKNRPWLVFRKPDHRVLMLHDLRGPTISSVIAPQELQDYIFPFFSDQIHALNISGSYQIKPVFSKHDADGNPLDKKNWRYGVLFTSPNRGACQMVERYKGQWGFGHRQPLRVGFIKDATHKAVCAWTNAFLDMLDEACVPYYLGKIPTREQQQKEGQRELILFFVSRADFLRADNARRSGLVKKRMKDDAVQLPPLVLR